MWYAAMNPFKFLHIASGKARKTILLLVGAHVTSHVSDGTPSVKH